MSVIQSVLYDYRRVELIPISTRGINASLSKILKQFQLHEALSKLYVSVRRMFSNTL